MSIIIAKPASAPSSANATTLTRHIPAVSLKELVFSTNTEHLDDFLCAEVSAAKYLVLLNLPDDSKMQVFEMLVTHNSVTPYNNQYNIMGDAINYDLTVDLISGTVYVDITNNESSSLFVYATRLTVPTDCITIPTLAKVKVSSVSTLVPDSITEAIDVVDINNVNAVRWNVAVYDTNSNGDGVQVCCLNNAGTVTYSVFGYSQTFISNFDVTVTTDSDYVILNLVNNSGNTVRVDVSRVPVQNSDVYDNCPLEDFIWTPSDNTILPGKTKIIDGKLSTLDVRSMKWIVNAINTTTNASMAYEVNAVLENTTTASGTVFSIVGSFFNLSTTVSIFDGKYVCVVTNNTSDEVHFNLIRMPILL